MALWAMGDFHLSFQVPEKSQERFGAAWIDHEGKIRKYCSELIAPDDTLVITGDISWGRKLSECEEDFRFIEGLPGRKILLRGNHDMFWDAGKTEHLNQLFAGRLFFLQNNFASYGDYALVGTKGCCFENLSSFEKFLALQEREVRRLKKSFSLAEQAHYQKFIMFLHYPPTSSLWPPTEQLCDALGMSEREKMVVRGQEQKVLIKHGSVDMGRNPVFNIALMNEETRKKAEAVTQFTRSPFTDIAEAHGVEQVIYSHCHGVSRFHDSLSGDVRLVRYQLVSGDYLGFRPFKVLA